MTEKNKNIRNFPNSRNLPKLRFSEFIEEWEVKELREVCEINPKNSTLPNSFIYIDLESVINGVLMKENQLFSVNAPSRAQRILKKNDILFQMVRPYQKNNFFFHLDGNYVASTGYAQIRTQQDSQYIFQYLHNQKFVDKVIDRCTGTSYPAINSTDLSKIPIFITSIQEQQKISSFLKLTDCRIATQKKIIDDLIVVKNSTVKKLFEDKVKFKNDDFPRWEKKRLNEISKEHLHKNPNNLYSEVFSVSKHKGVINQIEHLGRSFSAKEITHYKLVYPGDLVYTKSPTSEFPFGIIKQNRTGRIGVVSPLYCVFTPTTFALGYLLHEYFNSSVNTFNYLNPLVQKGAKNTMNINNDTFLNGAKLSLPMNEDEQNKIYTFLYLIENKINIEQKLLTQFENQKKYLLANLFV